MRITAELPAKFVFSLKEEPSIYTPPPADEKKNRWQKNEGMIGWFSLAHRQRN